MATSVIIHNIQVLIKKTNEMRKQHKSISFGKSHDVPVLDLIAQGVLANFDLIFFKFLLFVCK